MSAIKYYQHQQSIIADELELIDDDLRESMRETNQEDWTLLYVDDKPNYISTPDERSVGST